MRDQIRWLGKFEQMPGDYSAAVKKFVGDFLEGANLLCPGVSVVGYEYVEKKPAKRLSIIAHPRHLNYIDLLVGIAHEWRATPLWSGMKVRVMWHCNGLFPLPMGVPTCERLWRAVAEFSRTGKVKTKNDDRPSIPAYAAAMALGVGAIMQNNFQPRA